MWFRASSVPKISAVPVKTYVASQCCCHRGHYWIHTFTSMPLPIATSKRHSELGCSSCVATVDATVGAKAAACRLANVPDHDLDA